MRSMEAKQLSVMTQSCSQYSDKGVAKENTKIMKSCVLHIYSF